MKCLSVRQPFAWAILKGIKKVENRSRFPDFEGPVLIHTGKTFEKLSGKFPDGTPIPEPSRLPLGAIVGAAVVVTCWPIEMVEGVQSGEIKISHDGESTFIDHPHDRFAIPRDPDLQKHLRVIANDPFTSGPECILLDSPIDFKRPVPFSGQVGLFNVDETKLHLAPEDRNRLQELLKQFSQAQDS